MFSQDCFDSLQKKFAVRIGCGHEFSREYLNKLVECKIENKDKSSLKCPTCFNIFNIQDFKSEISKPILQKYNQMVLHYGIYQQVSRIGIYCPILECQQFFIMENPDNLVTCPKCQVGICVNCLQLWHEGKGCQILNQQPNIIQKIQPQQVEYRKCPKCQKLVQRIRESNYLKCSCGIRFCLICLEILERNQTHLTHNSAYNQQNEQCYFYKKNKDGNQQNKKNSLNAVELYDKEIQQTYQLKQRNLQPINLVIEQENIQLKKKGNIKIKEEISLSEQLQIFDNDINSQDRDKKERKLENIQEEMIENNNNILSELRYQCPKCESYFIVKPTEQKLNLCPECIEIYCRICNKKLNEQNKEDHLKLCNQANNI